jgi:hypothetical protein
VRFWDLSAIPFADFSFSSTFYEIFIGTPVNYLDKNDLPRFGLLLVSIYQDEKVITSEYEVEAVDIILANAGGYSTVIW